MTPSEPAVEVAFTLLASSPVDGRSSDDVVSVVGSAFNWEAGLLWESRLLDDDLVCSSTWSASPELSITAPGHPSPIARQALALATPLWAEIGSLAEESDALQEWNGVLAIPVKVGSQVTGLVELYRRDPIPPDPEIMTTLASLAEPLGGWLEHRRQQDERDLLLGRLRTAERRQRFLAEVSEVLAGTLDERRMLKDLAHLVASRVADFCSIHLAEDDGPVDLVALEAGAAVLPETEPLLGYPPGVEDEEGVGRVLRTGMSILYPTITDALIRAVAKDDLHLKSLRRLAPRSVMIVPMPGRGRTLGALTLATLDPDRVYSNDDLALLEDVGRRAGLAMASSQMYRRERATAAMLQEGLLPPTLPNVPGIELAARYRAAGEGLVVGGDFYDAFQVGSDTWVLGIGDVCGHGPAAASLSSRVRHSARAVAGFSSGPAELLDNVNQLLRKDASQIHYCTALYAWLTSDQDGLRLTLGRAGHPLPVFKRRSGPPEEVSSNGNVLGPFDTVDIEEKTVELESGDMVVLYTDGVSESRRRGEFLGSRPILELLASSSEPGAEATARGIERMALDYCGGRLRDDTAILVIAVEPG